MSDAPARYTTLRDYLRVLREQRLLIVLIVLAFVGAAIAVSLRQTPVYEASASLSFRPEAEDFDDIGAPAANYEPPFERAAKQAQLATDLDVAKRVKKRLDSEREPAALASDVIAQAEARTNFVVVTARSTDPEQAADLANAFAREAAARDNERLRTAYRERASALRRQNRRLRGTEVSTYTRSANVDRINRLDALARFSQPASVAVQASVPGRPVSPKPVRNSILGLFAGLTFGLLAAFVRDALDRRFRSVRDIKDELKVPLIGHVRNDTLGRAIISSNGTAPLSDQDLEAFRILRTNVDFLDVDRNASRIVVTSGLPEEGKSTVASALAAAYATSGRRVLLAECDLRRPTLAARFGLSPGPGLSDYLVGKAIPADVLQSVPVTDDAAPDQGGALVCITAGTATPRPAELLGSARFKQFLDQVSEVYDVIILDSAPLLSVGDTLELVPLVERVVLCIRASRTTRDQARAAKAALDHFPDRPTGVVVTGLRPGDETDYGYYSYAYAYGPQTSAH